METDRRTILRWLGKGSVFAAFVAQIGAAARAFFPNVLYEPPTTFKLKPPQDYPQGYTFDSQHRLFVVRAAAEVPCDFRGVYSSGMHRAMARHRIRLSLPWQPLRRQRQSALRTRAESSALV